jgi:hypothetical protein
MVDTPERPLTETPSVPESGIVPESGGQGVVQEQAPRPESYLERLEKHNVQIRPDDVQQPVVGDQGQILAQPIPSNIPTITIPANQQQIMEWAKGPDDKAITWLSRYWIRMIKKAVHYGWRLIMPPPPGVPQQQSGGPTNNA